jgi:hypothetical protein
VTEARPAAGLVVSALIRRIEVEGGHGMVLAKGDATAGAILLSIIDRGESKALLERSFGIDGYLWSETGPAEAGERDAYLARRRRTDPDMWIVELDHPDAWQLALALLA